MPQLVRVGDLCTGHECWPPRPSISGSRTVFSDGLAMHRKGDQWATHCRVCGKRRPCHSGVLASASSNVFADGRQVGRVGDLISCGSRCARGSSRTFSGG